MAAEAAELPPQPAIGARGRDYPAGGFTMGERTMREWVSVPAGPDPAATRDQWTGLAREALAHVLRSSA